MMDPPADEVLPAGELLAHEFFAEIDVAAIARGEIEVPDVSDYIEEGLPDDADSYNLGVEAGIAQTEDPEEDEDDEDDMIFDYGRFNAGMFYDAGKDPLPEFNYTAEVFISNKPAHTHTITTRGSSSFDLHRITSIPSTSSPSQPPPIVLDGALSEVEVEELPDSISSNDGEFSSSIDEEGSNQSTDVSSLDPSQEGPRQGASFVIHHDCSSAPSERSTPAIIGCDLDKEDAISMAPTTYTEHFCLLPPADISEESRKTSAGVGFQSFLAFGNGSVHEIVKSKEVERVGDDDKCRNGPSVRSETWTVESVLL